MGTHYSSFKTVALAPCVRMEFKVLIVVYKCLNGLGPSYLSELLLCYEPWRTLRYPHFNKKCELKLTARPSSITLVLVYGTVYQRASTLQSTTKEYDMHSGMKLYWSFKNCKQYYIIIKGCCYQITFHLVSDFWLKCKSVCFFFLLMFYKISEGLSKPLHLEKK